MAQQDWAVRMETAQLARWAQTLLGGVPYSDALPYEYKRPLPALWLDDRERWAIARYLHGLAQLPRVVATFAKARPRPAKQRGRPAQADRAWRIALDYLVTHERLGKGKAKRAMGEVKDAWGVGRAQIYEALKSKKHANWTEWEQYERLSARATHPGSSENDVLLRISQKMRSPENYR
jgi:hypothetical protein